MHNLVSLEPIDYLMVGHVAHDLTPGGWRLGGTTAYSALAARALGMRVGILTACEDCMEMRELEQEGIVRRTVVPDTPVRVEYALTEKGRSLETAIVALGKWAERWVMLDAPAETSKS